MKPTPEEIQQGVEEYHNKGQADGSEGKSHETPHGVMERLFSGNAESEQKLLDENDAYLKGWEHGRSQPKKG